MVDERPDLDLSDPEGTQGFPWLIILGIVIVTVIFGIWLSRSKAQQATATSAIEQQRIAAKVVLDQEHDKVFQITQKLDVLKQQINAGQVPHKAAAIAEYNTLAADQRTQREKVKQLADQYNQIVAKLHELQ